MTIMLGCLGLGLYVLAKMNIYVLGSILSIIGAYFSYKEFKKSTNTVPQITISNQGMKTVSTEFYEWKDIKDEEAIIEGYGKQTRHYLIYSHPEGFEHLSIDYLNTNQKTLNKLLLLYRGRSKERDHAGNDMGIG